MQLTEEQIEFYSAMEGTFLTPGWTLLTRGWKNEQDGLAESMLFNAQSMDDINATRVRYALLNELVSLPETIAGQKKQTEEMDEDESYV